MTFSPAEMLEVARHVYKDLPLETNFRGMPLIPRDIGGYVMFSPDINGTGDEQAQACQCIVAAFRLLVESNHDVWLKGDKTIGFRFMTRQERDLHAKDFPSGSDPLSASISAILSHIGVKHER